MTQMLDDSWVRLQIYVPELVRYKIRILAGTSNDSKTIRWILYQLLSDEYIGLLKEILEKK